MSRRLVAGLLPLLLAACTHTARHVPVPSDYPQAPVAPASSFHDFLRVQTIVATAHGRQYSMQAVLQKIGGTLTLVGLTPFGAKAFVLEQHGSEIRFKPYLMKELPFPPEFVLNDIRRTYFGGLNEGVLANGWHQADHDGERIRERWQDGRLMERQFTRLQGDPPGAIVIQYGSGLQDERAPETLEIDNGWLGYHLTIHTVSEQRLTGG